MKKIALFLVVGAMAVSGAFAQTKKAPTAPKELPCAVMPDHKVNIANATKHKMYADYNGRRYFFCCGGCPGAFKADPKKYAKKENSIPTPKAPAKKKG